MSGDGVEIARPLFQEEGDGVIPISPLQIIITKCNIKKAVQLNRAWHSRLPEIVNWQACFSYVAEFGGRYWAVAIWGPPIARLFNGLGYLELRRMAIRDDAPKNTASRMLAVMTRFIKRDMPDTKKLLSYQDSAVHSGTIYNAAGWQPRGFRKGGALIWNNNVRKRNLSQADGDKIRWERDLTIGG
jgi:hypothetical protein